MFENNNQDRYYCSFCGSNLPESFVEKLKDNSGVLICEQCGAEITKENFSTHESLIEVEEKEACNDNSILKVKHEAGLEDYSTVERYCLVMRSFMCRRIYDFFKKIKYSVRVYEDKGLDSFQLKVLARDFRKWLKKTSFQVKWINDPISVSFDEYLKFFQTFKAHLRYKKFYRTQYLDFIRDSLQLVMGLIVGRVQASSLSGIDREIYDDLKRYSCFIVNDDARDNFKFNLTIFLSWFIYRRAKDPISYRKLVKSDDILSERQVNKSASVIVKLIKEKPLEKDWIDKFRGADKRKFKKDFKEFQHLLKNDQLYCDVVFDYSCWLIRLVLDLIRGKYSSAELDGIKLEVLKHLKWRQLFEKDRSLSVEFKRNILIVLSRVINLNFNELEKSSGLKASQMRLKETAINALVSGLKAGIAGKDEINGNFLGNLKDITLLDFRNEYERFQSNLKSDWIYSESFSLNLYKLISDVFRLISEPTDHSSLNDYEKAIFDDLVAYNFNDLLSKNDGEKRKKERKKKKWSGELVERVYSPLDNFRLKTDIFDTSNNITYKEVLNKGNLSKAKTNKYYFLEWNINGTPRTKDEALEEAVKYLKTEILTDDYKKKYGLGIGEAPSSALNDKKLYNFTSALGIRKLTYKEVLNKGNLSKAKTNKYYFLEWDINGTPRTKDEALEEAVKYLKTEILTDDYKKKYGLGIGEAPSSALNDKKLYNFSRALGIRNLTYKEVLKKGGLIKAKNTKWTFLNWNENGIPQTKDEALDAAARYFKTKILTNDFRKKHNLSNGQTLLKTLLQDEGHKDYFIACEKRHLGYNDIVKKAKLEVKFPKRGYMSLNTKWAFLSWSKNNEPRSYKKAVLNAVDYFNTVILTKEFRKKHNLAPKEAPPKIILDTYGYKDFLAAIGYRSISYNDILEEAGYIPHYPAIFQEIGINFHWIGERIFLQYTRKNGCISFYEIYPSKNNINFLFNHCDNTIIVNKNFRNLSVYAKNIPKRIIIINIDYFLGRDEKYIKEKCLRGYQGEGKMLILVSLNAIENISVPIDVPYRKNVKIMAPEMFAEFMGYDNSYNNSLKNEFLDYVELAKESSYIIESRMLLQQKADESKQTILRDYNHKQEEFEEYLKFIRRLNLLENNPEKSTIDYYF